MIFCKCLLTEQISYYNPVSKVAVFKSTNPIFGAVFSAIILGESEQLLSWFTLIALVLVCLGIFVINKFGERKPKPKQAVESAETDEIERIDENLE